MKQLDSSPERFYINARSIQDLDLSALTFSTYVPSLAFPPPFLPDFPSPYSPKTRIPLPNLPTLTHPQNGRQELGLPLHAGHPG